MDWRDEGFLLTARRHGESAAIVEVFTARHGRHAGVVRGGGSRRMAPVLQPGTRLAVEWSARLEEHIGSFRIDPIAANTAAAIMADGPALAALAAMTALVAATLPERDAHPDLYARSLALLDALATAPDWPRRYAAWELALLAELGFGLDLAACALTGSTQDLAWVSPRTGRAVSRTAGAPWADRLLALPAFLRGVGDAAPEPAEIAAALALTGHFLDARVAPGLPRGTLPPARARAVAAILRPYRRRQPSTE
jgi:DNA repair protein RecO (recombination protein O)